MKKLLLMTTLLLTACGTVSSLASNTTAKIALDKGVALYQAKDYQTARTYFEQADNQGHMKAPRYLGLMLLNGLGVEKNPEQAFVQFQKAADKGDITSQYWLGYLYENGVGIAQNYAKALDYYQQSAQRGDIISAPALMALGRIYEQGIGVKADRQLALDWYQKALNAGEKQAETAIKRIL
ncbi:MULTISPECIES: tetratricopeptide repeat protein [Glaesserella]|uniref:Sel1 repeat family protein n=1 Tax=Glaesserella australis TaxID=2094024 RepID=A0A328BW19_9PAST|nr:MULTISPECIES: tetratricopeptide repeat protein [Glaesserella]AUI65991.1 hypothetical protein CJD39_05105 [Glaesserella sp. 15-184]RAL18289.1 sel1 repeat family protein [Glaesserella australis]